MDIRKQPSLWEKLRTPFKVTLVFILIMALIAIIVIMYNFRGTDDIRIANLEKQLEQVRAGMNVDSMRQYNIQKVISIIDQYNAVLSTDIKYEIASEIVNMAIKYPNLSVELICATISHESAGTWNPEIISKSGAMGLMQIMPLTGMFIATSEGIAWASPEDVLFNPIYNIRIGSRYLSTLIDVYDVDGGLAAYNGGEKRAALWVKNGRESNLLNAETRDYIPAVMRLYNEFQNLTL